MSVENHNHQWATDTHFVWGGGYHLVTYCTTCPARSQCPCNEVGMKYPRDGANRPGA